MSKEIFRKVSLERLSSPEKLDEMMQVTTPKNWLALATFIVLAFLALLWGIFGSLPTKVKGTGIFIKSGGVFKVEPRGEGELKDLRVSVGSRVEKGDIIARIHQPELLSKLAKARAVLTELNEEKEVLLRFDRKTRSLDAESIKAERENILEKIRNLQEKKTWLRKKLKSQKKLFEQGLITNNTFLDTKEQLHSTLTAINKLKSELKKGKLETEKRRKVSKDKISALTQKINNAKRQIESLSEKINVASNVISPFSGRVLEVMADVGDFVSHRKPLVTMELVGKEIQDLEAVFYIPVQDGKKVMPGMDVQISPSTANAQEFGFMKGKITSVADFPSTSGGMMRLLNNEKLVNMLSQQGAPLEIYADLIPSEETISGYKWSSPQGAPMKIYSGTLFSCTVVVKRQAPISLVIPLFRKYLLGYGE